MHAKAISLTEYNDVIGRIGDQSKGVAMGENSVIARKQGATDEFEIFDEKRSQAMNIAGVFASIAIGMALLYFVADGFSTEKKQCSECWSLLNRVYLCFPSIENSVLWTMLGALATLAIPIVIEVNNLQQKLQSMGSHASRNSSSRRNVQWRMYERNRRRLAVRTTEDERYRQINNINRLMILIVILSGCGIYVAIRSIAMHDWACAFGSCCLVAFAHSSRVYRTRDLDGYFKYVRASSWNKYKRRFDGALRTSLNKGSPKRVGTLLLLIMLVGIMLSIAPLIYDKLGGNAVPYEMYVVVALLIVYMLDTLRFSVATTDTRKIRESFIFSVGVSLFSVTAGAVAYVGLKEAANAVPLSTLVGCMIIVILVALEMCCATWGRLGFGCLRDYMIFDAALATRCFLPENERLRRVRVIRSFRDSSPQKKLCLLVGAHCLVLIDMSVLVPLKLVGSGLSLYSLLQLIKVAGFELLLLSPVLLFWRKAIRRNSELSLDFLVGFLPGHFLAIGWVAVMKAYALSTAVITSIGQSSDVTRATIVFLAAVFTLTCTTYIGIAIVAAYYYQLSLVHKFRLRIDKMMTRWRCVETLIQIFAAVKQLCKRITSRFDGEVDPADPFIVERRRLLEEYYAKVLERAMGDAEK